MENKNIPHILTVDLEDWNHGFLDRPWPNWPEGPSHLVETVNRLLDTFAAREARATFYCIGAVAEQHPELIREIVDRGHEIAAHGYAHRLIEDLGQTGFREDTLRCKDVLEQIAGQPVVGYRAPCFSVTRNTQWFDEILVELGFRHDSSRLPARWSRFGDTSIPRVPHLRPTANGPLIEIPATVSGPRWLSQAAGGGIYWRLFPRWWARRALRRCEKENRPMVIYLHPWEFLNRDLSRDVEPLYRESVSRGERFVHRHRLHRTAEMLDWMLSRVPFGRADAWLQRSIPTLSGSPLPEYSE